ncbi:MAG: hypothetical protein FWD82_10865, partial [Defluviitaleaceae bacterium]|nr:hypothetical protein [Defluviitaleaceae bacterium]
MITVPSVGNWEDVANVTPTLANQSASSASAVSGAILRARIHLENWFEDGDYYELDCGTFEIDSCELSGPPAVFEIKAVSTPISSSIRRETKNRAWEDTTLEEIAGDIASGAGLRLMYEVREEIKLDRVDQLKSADLSYLQKLCRNYGVSLKVTNKRVVLFDEKDYEARPPIDQFDFSEVVDDESNPTGRIISYKFIQDTSDTVSSSNVAYKDPKSGQLVHYEFTPQDAPATGQAVNINNRPGY